MRYEEFRALEAKIRRKYETEASKKFDEVHKSELGGYSRYLYTQWYLQFKRHDMERELREGWK